MTSDRRTFLKALGAAVLALPGARGRWGWPTAKLKRIGLQLYTVRGEMKKDFEGTLARVAEIGYQEVEFAGYFDRKPEAVKQALEKTGLSAPGAHLPFQSLDAWDQALEDAQRVGHQYLVIPGIPKQDRGTLDGYRRSAARFNQAGAKARAAGLRLGYHNHGWEFPLIEGKRPFDVLLAETDPATVDFEMDLYHITEGGGDPLAYFARYPGRFPLLHVKDSSAPPDRRMVDVGKGVIDFRAIFARREQAGVRHYFVEHDNPPDPFASIRASYQYLRQLDF